jgi:hypothetical protein
MNIIDTLTAVYIFLLVFSRFSFSLIQTFSQFLYVILCVVLSQIFFIYNPFFSSSPNYV